MIEIDPGIIDGVVLFEQVKATAKAQNISKDFYNTDDNYFAEVSIKQLHELMLGFYKNLHMMNATWEIVEKPLASTRPVIGKMIVFLKRIVRKSLRWLFMSFKQQQTEFNGAVTKTLSDMVKIQEMLIREYEERLMRGGMDED